MKGWLLFLMIEGFLLNYSSAQTYLAVEDISHPNDVFPNAGDSALILIRCHKLTPLDFFLFESDKTFKESKLIPNKTELSDADDYVYHFIFSAKKQNRVMLAISSPGMGSVTIKSDIGAKLVKSFRINRPFNFVVESCYPEHRDMALEEIKKGNYTEALEHLRQGNECFDKDSIENAENIRYVNMLVKFRKDGDAAFDRNDYKNAMGNYAQLYHLNQSDSFVKRRYKTCQDFLIYECNILYERAKSFYSEKQYKGAINILQEYISKAKDIDDAYNRDKLCEDGMKFLEKISSEYQTMDKKEKRRSEYMGVLTYEYRKDVPIGFAYSSLTEYRNGNFIQLDLNLMTFNELRSNCRYGDLNFSENNLAFGLTKKLFKYVWVHYGPGATFKLYHGTYLHQKYPTFGYGESDLLDSRFMGNDTDLPIDEIPDGMESAWKKTNLAFAVSPVVGLDLKYKFIALRLTYQYRFAIPTKLSDFMGRHRLSLGFGIAY